MPHQLPHPFAEDKLHEECGVFGIFGHSEAAALTALGLHALQHRGQEAAGIVTYDGPQFCIERHLGLVGDNFTNPQVMERLKGDRAIGHNRYSTAGGAALRNVQPLFAELAAGGFAVAHNGNITNAAALQRRLQRRGSIFQSTSDTETIIHLIATSERSALVERMIDALGQIEGAFSLVALSEEMMIGCRDPLGVRPLVLGTLDGAPVLASETCALDIIGATLEREILPGELVVVTASGIESRENLSRLPGRASASSNMSISPAPIRSSTEPASTRSGSGSARSLRARRRPPRTSSFRCRIPAFRALSGMRKRPGFPSISASSATTMSAALSSSRPMPSATWASSSSTTPTAPS